MKSVEKGPAVIFLALMLLVIPLMPAQAADLEDIKTRGVLRHLGVPYANFVTGTGDGMDTDLMKLFAQDLGVKYEFVPTSWENVIADLTGKKVKAAGDEVQILEDAPVKGDIIACGFTILPWRKKIVDYSAPTFPTQVWLVARAESRRKPITPSGDVGQDIVRVRGLLKGGGLLGKINTCLDPALYDLDQTGARVKLFSGGLNELAPAVINGESEMTLLDVPDALIALEKWPGKIKVLGPLSRMQGMGAAFGKGSPHLREAFNRFLGKCRRDGTYISLIKKYYPAVFNYYPDFFAEQN